MMKVLDAQSGAAHDGNMPWRAVMNVWRSGGRDERRMERGECNDVGRSTDPDRG